MFCCVCSFRRPRRRRHGTPLDAVAGDVIAGVFCTNCSVVVAFYATVDVIWAAWERCSGLALELAFRIPSGSIDLSLDSSLDARYWCRVIPKDMRNNLHLSKALPELGQPNDWLQTRKQSNLLHNDSI